MFYDKDEEIPVVMPKELESFVKEQVKFLEAWGIEDPNGTLLDTCIQVFHNLSSMIEEGVPLSVPNVVSFPGFSVERALEDLSISRNTEHYMILIPEEVRPLVEELKQITECDTDGDVILCSLCCFRWLIDVFKARRVLQYQEREESGDPYFTPYHIPILELYKSMLLQ